MRHRLILFFPPQDSLKPSFPHDYPEDYQEDYQEDYLDKEPLRWSWTFLLSNFFSRLILYSLKMDLRSSHGEVFVMSISDSQVFIALFAALLAGILAIRLGIELYT